MLSESLLVQLKKIIPENRLFTIRDGRMEENEFLDYGKDRTKVYSSDFDTLVFPENTLEISSLLKFAYENNIKIVPSGGRTGYAGGAVAKNKELVISLSKMNKEIFFDDFLGSIKIQAGMITKSLHKVVEEKGYFFPVDFASTGSSHIGGNIATNAGGVRVVRYGLIRDWVLGLTVVTGKGEILEFNGEIIKNNTGYDLKQLFIGSEGTLGIITEATLKLTKIPKDTQVVFVAVDRFEFILEIFKKAKSIQAPLLAFEFLTDFCLEKVCHHLSLSNPFGSPSSYYVLMEFELVNESIDEERLMEFLTEISSNEWILDGSIAQNSRQKETFWKYREGISESISIGYTVHKNDISVPLQNMKPFIGELTTLIKKKYPEFQIALFGHVGDGNLHLNILKPANLSDLDFFNQCKEVDPELFELLKKYNGSISAEHGIGLLKKDFLTYSRTEEEIEIMKKIKSIFDPKNILNPGKIF